MIQELRHIGATKDAGCDDNVAGFNLNLLAIAIDYDFPSLSLDVVSGASFDLGSSPKYQVLRDCVGLHPVGQFVSRGEERPVIRKRLVEYFGVTS